jgi:5'-methylthioadenosine phosphorylase
MEGPQFSTRAESNVYRGLGLDLIGMTNLQEAKLAREAEICYSTLALVTDYDCWHPQHDAVTVAEIVANLTKNSSNAQKIIPRGSETSADRTYVQMRRVTPARNHDGPEEGPEATKKRLELLIKKYL